MIIKNQIRCNHCGDLIESTHRHDFRSCKCGRVSVDGGHDYLKRCFQDVGDFEELSIISENEDCDDAGDNQACV